MKRSLWTSAMLMAFVTGVAQAPLLPAILLLALALGTMVLAWYREGR